MRARVYRSTKNVLHSIGKNYDIHSLSQHTWRFQEDHKWSNEPRKSSLAGNTALQKSSKQITLLGKQTKVNLDSVSLNLVLDMWGVEDKSFDSFRDKYKKYADEKKRKREVPEVFAKWRCLVNQDNTAEEQKWQSIPETAYKVERVLLDGVLFRCENLQIRKGLKTDNSCVICHANISYAVGKQRRAREQIEKCYGRFDDAIYVHFKYPPSKQQLSDATHKKRLDPCKVGVPYLVLGKCTWYMQAEEPHQITGLTQIKPHPEWDKDCPFVKLQDCLALNVAYWPANPFEEVTKESDMVVITHHEEVPVVYNAR